MNKIADISKTAWALLSNLPILILIILFTGIAIKPVALRMVWQVVQKVKIPVIGVGEIMTPEDALEFLIAGAAAVQVGTANFINPNATIEIIEGIEEFLIKNNISRVMDIVGTLEI